MGIYINYNFEDVDFVLHWKKTDKEEEKRSHYWRKHLKMKDKTIRNILLQLKFFHSSLDISVFWFLENSRFLRYLNFCSLRQTLRYFNCFDHICMVIVLWSYHSQRVRYRAQKRLTLSRGIFNFKHQKYFSRASIICDF